MIPADTPVGTPVFVFNPATRGQFYTGRVVRVLTSPSNETFVEVEYEDGTVQAEYNTCVLKQDDFPLLPLLDVCNELEHAHDELEETLVKTRETVYQALSRALAPDAKAFHAQV
jgi:hypothetical protein